MDKYNPEKIEKKWQDFWKKHKSEWQADDFAKKPKFYTLFEFPYPSGDGLHMGHLRGQTAVDVFARKKRLEGYNVLTPIGWDAFGLPTENYAIKNKIHPSVATKNNISKIRQQEEKLGYFLDWDREINTTDPQYYRWTQWIFLKLFEKGLAYKTDMPINWCPSCKIGLANEEVIDDSCERCGAKTTKRQVKQWVLKITKYADKLLEGLEKIEFPDRVKTQQINWIGRKEGINITYDIDGMDEKVTVFTTRPDTNYGATFIVIAPEHPLSSKIATLQNKKIVDEYINQSILKSDLERQAEGRKKTGAFTGRYAINQLTGKKMPIYVADFVLMNFGTGAVVAVPGHDLRDFEFAQEFKLPVLRVVVGKDNDKSEIRNKEQVQESEGKMINSGILDGLDIHQATEKIMDYLEEKGWGKRAVSYRLRDWIFSRQHYWGEPIPVVFCKKCKHQKYDIIILHGFGSDSTHSWKPWLIAELKKLGHNVYCPDLPNTNKPNIIEQAEYVLKNTRLSENSIVIGHSLGGAVLLRLLERSKTKIKKAIFLDSVLKPKFSDKLRPDVANADDWSFDFAKIKKASRSFLVVADADYPTIRKEEIDKLAKILVASKLLLKPVKPHFRGDTEPELLDLFRSDGLVPVPENDLPVTLPAVEHYEPSNTGESPLSKITDWVNTTCPECGGSAKRETDTMPNWAGSSWYFLRYIDPQNDKKFAALDKLKYWLPIDLYEGGMEHTTLHLLYSRFWNEFLYDIGVVPVAEPYKKRVPHGIILAADGRKMSKSFGNVVRPDDLVAKFGADTIRLYAMFLGPFDQAVAWDDHGVIGVYRFLNKVWQNYQKPSTEYNADVESQFQILINSITGDIDNFSMNTAVAKLMEFNNILSRLSSIPKTIKIDYLKLLYPFAPHIAEELQSKISDKTIFTSKWPISDKNKIKDTSINIVVQINAKKRDQITLPQDSEDSIVKEQALKNPKIKAMVEGKTVKTIIVKNKLINFVTK